MRALTVNEMEITQGAGFVQNLVTSGLFSEANITAATRFATGLGLVVAAAKAGWEAGEWLVEHTPVETWASFAIEYYIEANANGSMGCH